MKKQNAQNALTPTGATGALAGKKHPLWSEMKKNRSLFLMLLPALLLVLLFKYIPLGGIVLAFKDYRYDLGIVGSPWVGLQNFKFFFLSGTGLRVTVNTIVYNAANLITSQLLSLVLAVVLNEIWGRRFKKIIQSVSFLPYFVSWILVGAFVYNIFNVDNGVLNHFLVALGHDPINLYAMPSAWFFIIMIFNSWKWVGYNSVVYIAAITGIDSECYEAADIDGANVWQKIWRITLPSIKPTVITIVLLNVGRILRGDFQMFYQIVGRNGQLYDATDVIDTFVFRSLASGGDIGMTMAATLYQSVLCFIIIVGVNALVKKIDSDYALF
ncbi:MAG: ABC transporter permease subunit [Gemmiger sp.]|nr:ABC transporter permease subunit [Gemmiger sp.]